MVGGMIRKDDGLPAINTANIFSALESRRRKSSKKRSDKDKAESKGGDALQQQDKAPAQAWTPTPVSVASWADCEEDDDDYFALPALPPVVDQSSKAAPTDLHEELSQDESEGDDELDDEVEEDNEEEQESEAVEASAPEKVPALSGVQPTAREPERQLSKKELKKKELAELDAVLAELGLNNTKVEKESTEEGASCETNGAVEQTENSLTGPVLTESKSSKRRKAKKDKSVKGEKEDEGAQETEIILKEEASVEEMESESAPADRKEVLKKIASMKKKKSFKESDGAAKAAAAEAAARAAKLAAAKKKEKNHYNQQPVR